MSNRTINLMMLHFVLHSQRHRLINTHYTTQYYIMLFEEEYEGDKQISLFCKLCETHITSRKCGWIFCQQAATSV